MLNIETAQKIFSKYRLGKVNSIENQESGITGTVFGINNKYIIKIQIDATDAFRSERNAFVCGILAENSIKAPLLVALDTSREIIPVKYIIITKLEGENLKYVWKNLSKDEQKNIFFKYGKVMARFHQISLKKFGDPANDNEQFDFWHECILFRYKGYYDYVKRNNIISDEVLNDINSFFVKNDKLLQIKVKPVLVHNDFQTKNIKYYQSGWNGIFDFDESIGAHNEMDFIKTCLPFKAEKIWLDEILKGYKTSGSLSEDFSKRIKLYELNFCLKVLKFTHANNLLADFYKRKFSWAVGKILKEDWRFLGNFT